MQIQKVLFFIYDKYMKYGFTFMQFLQLEHSGFELWFLIQLIQFNKFS